MTGSLILWTDTRFSLRIFDDTWFGFELYFNNFFHQLQVNVYSFANIFHIFTKYAAIHKIEEVFFKWTFRINSLVCIKIYILFQPRWLIELLYLMNLFLILIQNQDVTVGFCNEVHTVDIGTSFLTWTIVMLYLCGISAQ